MSAKDGPPGDRPPDEGTEDGKSAETDADNGARKVDASDGANERSHPLLAVLFWVVSISFSAFVAFSNHWLADTLLALAPFAAVVLLIVWGIIMLRKK